MTGILSPHPLLRRGGITRTTRVLARSGAITRDDGEDPLADIPTTLRLQSHRGEVDGTIRYFQATGAGSAGVNQRYSATGVTNGRPHYDAPNGSFLYWAPDYGATGAWRITISDGTEDYFSEGDNPLPPVSGWGNGSGTSPAPSVTRLEFPRIKPLGLYKDTACTIPATHDGDAIAAWRDELSGSGLVAVQSITSRQPALRFTGGIPWLDFDGIDDLLHIPGIWSGSFSASVGGKRKSLRPGIWDPFIAAGPAAYGPFWLFSPRSPGDAYVTALVGGGVGTAGTARKNGSTTLITTATDEWFVGSVQGMQQSFPSVWDLTIGNMDIFVPGDADLPGDVGITSVIIQPSDVPVTMVDLHTHTLLPP
ncbi:hypothetical protein OVA24_17025 [Luteolibacter sp. SL250]|uniref:hypothetical protein n=1 Tax=Luteolibacter sp. SL250 TaxID=2995170 RepID=UPI00226DB344|nr:hypothetical protein [Luteolibacter sp. SL250]WAC18937.1 hypothetical protein OVA24_17025 [Luteolibacter sp. SL250]